MRAPLVALLLLSLACAGGTGPSEPPAPTPATPSTPSTPPSPPTPAPVVAVPLAFPGTELPPEVKVTGTPVAGARWTDTRGENWLVLTRQGDGRSAELRGWLYARGPGGWSMVWDIVDFVRDCEFDLTLDLVPGSLRVTDHDADGEAESAFVYRLACRSDPSPADQKLLMHEGGTKYALRGRARVDIPGIPADGGEFRADPAFANAPPTFLPAASALWAEFVTESP